jgi:hypothetical protein
MYIGRGNARTMLSCFLFHTWVRKQDARSMILAVPKVCHAVMLLSSGRFHTPFAPLLTEPAGFSRNRHAPERVSSFEFGQGQKPSFREGEPRGGHGACDTASKLTRPAAVMTRYPNKLCYSFCSPSHSSTLSKSKMAPVRSQPASHWGFVVSGCESTSIRGMLDKPCDLSTEPHATGQVGLPSLAPCIRSGNRWGEALQLLAPIKL